MIRLVIIDDHALFIDGVKAMLKNDPEIAVKGTAFKGSEAISMIHDMEADVALMDINLPDIDGIALSKRLLEIRPSLRILAVTMHNEHSFIKQMLKNGATGYVLKNIGKEELIKAVKEVHQGKSYFSSEVTDTMMAGLMKKQAPGSPKLSRREKEVLELIVHEHTTQEIADKLCISLNTVESHRKNLLAKLGVRNSAGLVRVAMERNLLP